MWCLIISIEKDTLAIRHACTLALLQNGIADIFQWLGEIVFASLQLCFRLESALQNGALANYADRWRADGLFLAFSFTNQSFLDMLFGTNIFWLDFGKSGISETGQLHLAMQSRQNHTLGVVYSVCDREVEQHFILNLIYSCDSDNWSFI